MQKMLYCTRRQWSSGRRLKKKHNFIGIKLTELIEQMEWVIMCAYLHVCKMALLVVIIEQKSNQTHPKKTPLVIPFAQIHTHCTFENHYNYSNVSKFIGFFFWINCRVEPMLSIVVDIHLVLRNLYKELQNFVRSMTENIVHWSQ